MKQEENSNSTSESNLNNNSQQNSALNEICPEKDMDGLDDLKHILFEERKSNETNACSCGCGFEVGSPEFMRLHVESQEEQERRVATEQYNAEQEAQAEDYTN